MHSTAARRVLDASLDLFSERGYALTTIGDVEVASGLTRGAGGVYRHFSSKYELLEKGLREQLDALDRAHGITHDDSVIELRDLLTLHARVGLTMIRGQRSLIRLLYRDLDQFPELVAEVKKRLVYTGTREFASRLRKLAKERDLDTSADFVALATIFAGAVTNIGVIEATLDETAPVSDDRLVATWADVLHTYLTAEHTK